MSAVRGEARPAGDHFGAMRHRRNKSGAPSACRRPECGFRQPNPRSRVL